MQQTLVIEQRRPDCGTTGLCACIPPGEDPHWEVVVRELPPGVTSVILPGCRVIVVTPAAIDGWIGGFIAMHKSAGIQ